MNLDHLDKKSLGDVGDASLAKNFLLFFILYILCA